jgi:phosphopantothenoylcysteine decarboxylase/phosphopantothenate--cysteine ligase
VGDFRPKSLASQKIKKQSHAETTLNLERTTDILALLSARRAGQLLIGFAAETQNLFGHAMEKLRSKGLDLIVANDVSREGAGFGADQNAAVLIDRDGIITELSLRPKRQLADDVLNAALRLLRNSRSPIAVAPEPEKS